jgi:hypothetical protein
MYVYMYERVSYLIISSLYPDKCKLEIHGNIFNENLIL